MDRYTSGRNHISNNWVANTWIGMYARVRTRAKQTSFLNRFN